MKKSIKIIFFSGTGGTACAAKVLKEKCEEEHMEVSRFHIYQNNRISVSSKEILVMMYPVYAADAPRAIYQFIKTLPKGHNEIILIPVSGGGYVSPNTAASYHVKRLLEKKGYVIRGDYHLVMPSNFIVPTEHVYALDLIHVLPSKCERIAKDIFNGKHHNQKPLFRDRIIRVLCSVEKQGAKIFGRLLKVNESCTSCGLCKVKCPSGNIRMINGHPKFAWSCNLCMACIYACPHKAIVPRMMSSFVLKEGYNLKGIIEQANLSDEHFVYPKSEKKIWLGVIEYIKSDNI